MKESERREYLRKWVEHFLARYLTDYAMLRQDGTRPATGNLNMDDHNIANIGEIQLTPKASSTGAEGTIFYDSDDDHVYVATE